MPLVQVPQNATPCQIDDFGEGCERSKVGALYFTPGSTKELTADELAHIEKNHKALARKLVRIPFDDSKGRVAKAKVVRKSRPSDRPTAAQRKAAGGKKAPAPTPARVEAGPMTSAPTKEGKKPPKSKA